MDPTSRPVLDIARLEMSDASGQGGSQDAAADGCVLVHCHTSTLPLVPVPCVVQFGLAASIVSEHGGLGII